MPRSSRTPLQDLCRATRWNRLGLIVCCVLCVVCCVLCVVCCVLWFLGCGLWAIGCGKLWVVGCMLSIIGARCRVWDAGFGVDT